MCTRVRSKPRALWRNENFQSRNPILRIRCSPQRANRLNRDDPGERSEHTSPVSRIITLFRSKPRARARTFPFARYSAQFLFDPPIHCFSSVGSAYFLSAEKLTASRVLFPTSETISRRRVDRSDCANLHPRLCPAPRPKILPRERYAAVSRCFYQAFYSAYFRGSGLFIVPSWSFSPRVG